MSNGKNGSTNAQAAAKAVRETYPTVALVLQGGGALGAYQAGVYQALAEADLRPSWIAGISIGALNAAIIAGNPIGHRVDRLREFWETICRPPFFPATPAFDNSAWPLPLQNGFSGLAAWRALTEGQSGFFHPRFPPPLLQRAATPATISWYDTAPLRSTLERLVDFDRINDARSMRVSIGAVNVRTGNFAYFDNTQGPLRVEHFMASGALPPGFPAVEIDGEFYWDGGMVSNTPLYKVLSERPCHDALIFQVDLWHASGQLPRDLSGVAERAKEIQYSSRTRLITEYMRLTQENQRLVHELMALVPPERRNDPAYRRAEARASGALTNLIHLIYRDKPYEGHYKDYEFSASSMQTHWQSGLSDMHHTLTHPHWLDAPTGEHPFVTHDLHRA
ncbi:patatin-like phospholipase family protein [Dyella subtropica]|uniref:patatin-like phospholipase family protein n=1 Tax=Dyella subtropica TaxID=2992127 RepID=UPI002257BFC5|nr:patatin-like phospholipase family protein [Dyella subtropica]